MFTEDEPSLPGQLYASFVKSTQACATILNIDTTPVAVSSFVKNWISET